MRHTTLMAALMTGTALVAAPAAAQEMHFNRIASFPVTQNLPADMDPETETSPEIIDVTADGMTLVYTDSPLGALGMVDITDPANPKPAGAVMLDGEPTSLAILGDSAFVAVNTSESFTDPSGLLRIVNLKDGTLTDSCDFGGQPDSAAVAKDGSFLTVAIENERDEDLNDGVIPQMPAGYVAIIPLADGAPQCDQMVKADVTGLAEIAGSDPEPEFVAVNGAGDIAVTLQENNHIVILASDGTVKSHFSAGSVTLDGVDTDEEGAITFNDTIEAKREPDAVKWVNDEHIVIANEGDYEGGSRGFTIFDMSGNVVFDSGLDFEYAVASIGHYPEERSGNKGAEPEGLEVGTYGDTPYIFVMSERGSVIGAYDNSGDTPVLKQLLPSGIGPESAVAIPSRGLLASANEADLGPDGGVRAHVMIYELQETDTPNYPSIKSDANGAATIPFGALSGLAADENEPTRLYAVNDSFYGMQPTIFVINAAEHPAIIEEAIPVRRGAEAAQKLDLEGIATDGEGGFFLGSEGRTDRLIPHAIYHVNADGEIEAEIPFPAELLAVEKRFGTEGIAKIGDRLWIAIQREWNDDPKGFVKLVSYDLGTKEWGAVRYPLETPEKGWIGLSEIAAYGDYAYILERDNQIGDAAKVKMITRVALSELEPAPLGGELPTVNKEIVRDLIPDLKAPAGFVVDKVEGLAITAEGTAFLVTDNDGVDDSSGESHFWSVKLN